MSNLAFSLKSKRASRGFDRVEGSSLRQQAYEAIKHRIVTCALKPGQYINEAGISKLLGLGRTPVHQALNQLMHENLVEVIPRKGVIVKPFSLDEVINIIEVRLVNETHAAALAAAQADETDIAEMTEILKRGRKWRVQRDIEGMMLADRHFHTIVARATRNDILAEVLRRLHDQSLRSWSISLSTPDRYQKVDDEHQDILQAIKARDEGAAREAMRDHIESFRRNVIRQ